LNLETRVQTKQYWPARARVKTKTFKGEIRIWPEKYFSTGAVFWEFVNEILEDQQIKVVWLLEGRYQIKMAEILKQNKTPLVKMPIQTSLGF